jgi:CspA family cold shock protein
MKMGIVKWFNNKKRYGFICTAEGTEVFVHYTEIGERKIKLLKKGELVEFDVEDTPRGPKAVHVKKSVRFSPTSEEDLN